MPTKKQKEAAKKNIKKAQKKWKNMSKEERAAAQPEGRKRAKPGSRGEGDYYRIIIRDKYQFNFFINDDVGDKGGIQRLAGQRENGSWDTHVWLIEKDRAEFKGGELKALDEDVQKVLDQLGSKPKHIKGDIFKAKPRKNIPEKDKPTKAQKEARKRNIKKAQEARKKK